MIPISGWGLPLSRYRDGGTRYPYNRLGALGIPIFGWGSLLSLYRPWNSSYSHNGLGSGIVIPILGSDPRVLPYKAEVPGYSYRGLGTPVMPIPVQGPPLSLLWSGVPYYPYMELGLPSIIPIPGWDPK